ncbi:hypothetical protein [Massilia sp. CF038]|uniref:hypothetical protein n=1 Tax=Massilia sp. CF038 TaxID=1881045 RepID=UPI00091802A6|nr:hypothetical protein [Massilia sp. CF038]SHG52822.1 hypothetical protein SAMN05428948_0880 [Massilia sp. CF038]
MKLISTLILSALCAMSIAVPAAAHERHCKCGTAFPAPPAPPTPPTPPGMPDMPVAPAPPAPPPVPEAPAEAHAACAKKAPGTKLSYAIKHGSMSGVCERDNRGMYFEVYSVHISN